MPHERDYCHPSIIDLIIPSTVNSITPFSLDISQSFDNFPFTHRSKNDYPILLGYVGEDCSA